jgi:hypothetical protein
MYKIKDEPIPYFLQYSQKKIGGFRKNFEGETDGHHLDESIKRKRSVTIAETAKLKPLATINNSFHDQNRTSRLLEKSELIDNSFKIMENEHDDENVEENEAEVFDVTQKLKM